MRLQKWLLVKGIWWVVSCSVGTQTNQSVTLIVGRLWKGREALSLLFSRRVDLDPVVLIILSYDGYPRWASVFFYLNKLYNTTYYQQIRRFMFFFFRYQHLEGNLVLNLIQTMNTAAKNRAGNGLLVTARLPALIFLIRISHKGIFTLSLQTDRFLVHCASSRSQAWSLKYQIAIISTFAKLFMPW